MEKLPYNLDQYNVAPRRIATNGIKLNVFEAGSGPLVLLLHGFPECWASWGPQIAYLVDEGYKVVALEMRGYGESDAPEAIDAYDTVELAADVAGVIDAYGQEQAVIIGHDWGCIVAWHAAWLHPGKIKGVGGLSVTWFGRGDRPQSELFAETFKDSYFYINDFQRPELNDQLNDDHRKSLMKVMFGDVDLLAMEAGPATFLERIPSPEKPPAFMPEEFINYMVTRYRFNGFTGPLNWYRNFQRTWERTEGLSDIIKPPAMFLCGLDDWPNQFAKTVGHDQSELFKDLLIEAYIAGGHWLGQERAGWVNHNISEFLRQIDYRP